MSTRFVRILLALLIVALISALFILNPQDTIVHFGRGNDYSAPMALVLILTFLAGAILAAVLAFISQFRLSLSHWRERRLRQDQREHLRELVTIRELVALEKWDEAQSKLKKVLKEDPDNAVARTLLATTLDALGDRRGALKVIEEGRGRELTSAELFLKAAELQEREGNLTAALDNLALLLQKDSSSKKVLTEAVRIASTLEDYKRAAEFQERLIKLSDRVDYEGEQRRLAQIELHIARKLPAEEQKAAIETLLRRHRNFSPALIARSRLEEASGELDAASRSITQAFVANGKLTYLDQLSQIWLRKDDPDRAVKLVRAALLQNDSPAGRAFLTSLLVALGMFEHAEKEVAQFGDTTPGKTCEVLLAISKARLLQTKGKLGDAIELVCDTLIVNLPESDRPKFLDAINRKLGTLSQRTSGKEQPAPQFSTP